MRSTTKLPSLLGAAAIVAATSACSEPDRAFAEGAGGSASSTGTTGGPSSSSGTGGAAGGGAPASTSTATTAAGGDCGNGELDPGEECDEATSLCSGCLLDCPAGWFRAGDACFSVALGDVTQVDALGAAARCGALAPLDVAAVGHRAQPAAPETAEQFEALAAACPNNGCWLGYFSLGPPGSSDLVAPASGATLFAEAPWAAGEPSRGPREVCTRLRLEGDAPSLEDEECTGQLAYAACQLSPRWGSTASCGDGERTGDEECDDPDDDGCVDCSRLCPEGTVEDPRTHACLFAGMEAVDHPSASDACSLAFGGASLATPAEVADVRILSLVGAGWVGASVLESGEPAWQSGEAWTFDPGQYPLAGDLGAPGTAAVLGEDGLLVWVDPTSLHSPLCEAFAR